MEVAVINNVHTDRPDLAAKVASACRMARQITGLSVQEYKVKLGYDRAVIIGDERQIIQEGIEAGRIIPSSIRLLIAAEAAGVPVGALLMEPDAACLVADLLARVARLEHQLLLAMA